MKEQNTEIIRGEKIRELLRSLIDTRRLCRMEIPRTSFLWLTLLLDLSQEEKGNDYLLIDGVADFEKALVAGRQPEITLEFYEKEGVPCQFQTRVIRWEAKEIWAALPMEIQRLQRRAFYRLPASSGTEIVFTSEAGFERKGKVRDYGLGGVALFADGSCVFRETEMVCNVYLIIPQEEEPLKIHIPLAQVKRVERGESGRETLLALEFFQMTAETRGKFGRHIFETQRSWIRKVKSIPPLARNF